MSFGQQRLWFQHQLEPDAAHHALGRAYDIRGALDVDALERALNDLVTRHEPLRTVYALDRGVPTQRVLPEMPVTVARLAVSAATASEAWGEVEAHLGALLRQPFDPGASPILRAAVVRIDNDRSALILTQRFIGADRWSRSIIHRELSHFYARHLGRDAAPLPPLPLRYIDFAAWQRERLQGPVLDRLRRYWTATLAGAPDGPALVADRAPAVRTRAGDQVFSRLSASLAARLSAIAAAHRATPFMLYLAAFDVLLHRYTGDTDIVVGSPVAGRLRREVEDLVGFFGNTLVFRTDLSGRPSFSSLLAAVRRTTLDAYAHQELPFERLVETLPLERTPLAEPLGRVLFAYQNLPDTPLALAGCDLVEHDAVSVTFSFELGLSLYPSASGLLVRAQYQTDRFRRSTIERLLAAFETLLEGIAADPGAEISRLPMLTSLERERAWAAWRQPTTPVSADAVIHQRFARQVGRTPEDAALTWRGVSVSYADLDARANRLAQVLTARGVRRGDVVALAIARSIDLVVSMLAVLKAGAAYLPIESRDPPARVRRMLGDAGARLVLADGSMNLEATDVVAGLDLREVMAAPQPPAASCPTTDVGPEDVAYVMYTSGSTGTPKGVAIPHRAVVRLVLAEVVPIGRGDAVLQAAPASFDASTFEIWATLLNGGRLVLLPDDGLDLDVLEAVLHEAHVTHAWLTASLFNAVVDDRPSALDGLRYLVTGGEALSVPHVRTALGRYPDLRLFNGYGPTEVTTFSLVHAIERPLPDDLPSIPIGRPLAHTSAFVLDDVRQCVPVGVPGELYLGGQGLALGYRGAPALTAERFVVIETGRDHPTRVYRTGDRVRALADGTLEFLGRIDRQVKVRGFRIELDEVEAALRAHPSVSACVVLVDEAAGGRQLVAYVVSTPEGRDATWRAHLQQRVPSYMVPSVFVRVDCLPVTAAGKVDRRALQGRPSLSDEAPRSDTRSGLEQVVARIWADALGRATIGPHERFFDIGGHSLLATQVVARLRTACQVELPLRAIFEAPTVAGLAAAIASLHAESRAAPAAVSSGRRSAPASFAQARLWFLEQLDPESGRYNSPRTFHVAGPLDIRALRQACDALIDRHPALRTSFTFDGEELRQVVQTPAPVPFSFEDLGPLDADARQAEATRRLVAEVGRPFRLDGAEPLMRVSVIRLGPDEHAVAITVHHIATDGWSMGILNRELAALYEASRNGTALALPPLPLEYVDYAIWQHQHLQGARLDGLLDYWCRHLEGLVPLQVPGAQLAVPAAAPRAARHAFRIDRGLVQAVEALGRAHGATVFMVCLAACYLTLTRLTGQRDIAVATPVANRTRPEFEGLIGFFVNTLVVRTSVAPSSTGRELLRQIRETVIEAFEHQECPFEKVVEALRPERNADRSPLTPMLFALQTAPDRGLSLSGLRVTRQPPVSERVRFDIEMVLRSDEGGVLSGRLTYRADIYDAPTMEALAESFVASLRALAMADTAPVLGAAVGAAGPGPPVARRDERSREAVRASRRETSGAGRGPLRPIEARVARVWSDVLGRNDIGPDEDFFDLGGHSLLAARVSLRLQSEFGRPVPVAALFEHSTIRTLSALLARGPDAAAWTPIVPLRRSGSRRPLFLVHGLGGEVVGFRDLAEHLPDDQPVYAIQGRSPAAPTDLPTAVDALCARYVEFVTAIDPDGPYCVGGYSAGGVLALELARQLEARGRRVALLAILDGGLPAAARHTYRWQAHTPVSLARHLWFWLVDDAARMPLGEWPERLASKGRSIVARVRGRIGVAGGPPLDVRDRLGIYRYPREYSAYVEPRFEAFQQYQPGPVACAMLFVRSRTGSLHGPPAEALVADWRRLTRGAFTSVSVPCSHRTLLSDPHVREVSRHLEDALARAALDDLGVRLGV